MHCYKNNQHYLNKISGWKFRSLEDYVITSTRVTVIRVDKANANLFYGFIN